MAAGPYSIGSDTWPGLAKVAEEAAEVIQVAGKLIANGGETEHWDGTSLRERLEDEIGDLTAAIAFMMHRAGLDEQRIGTRRAAKLAMFQRWHQEHLDGTGKRWPVQPSS